MSDTCAADTLAEAIEHRERGDCSPARADAHYQTGLVHYQQNELKAAISSFRKALEIQADDVRSLLQLGICHSDLKQFKKAKHYCQQVVELDPGIDQAWAHLGKACVETDEFEEGIYYFQQAFKLAKKTAYARGLAKGYRKSGRHTYARNILRQVLSEHPDDHEARFSLGWSLMHLEDFPEALSCLESRLHLAEVESFRQRLAPIFALPAYNGEDLRGKSLLLFTEQGFGDNIQFARYIRLLRPKVGKLVLWCREGLGELFRHNFDLDFVTENLSEIPPVDFRLPLMSIPHFFDNRLDAIDKGLPYLTAPPGVCDESAFAVEGLKVGLVWGAEPRGFDYDQKRVPLSQLAPLFDVPGVRWFSFQVGHDRKELASFKFRERIVDLGDGLVTFADTARALEKMDLVISCDTSVAHLAGAMGKPTWVMLKMQPDWRWQSDGESSRWYPGSKLYRQYARNEWSSVVRRIRAALAELAENHQHTAPAPTEKTSDPATQEKLALASRASAAGRYHEAIEIYQEILEKDPKNASLVNELGVVWYREGNLTEARRFFAQAVKIDPDYPRALANLGACHNELGDNPSAIACYEKAVALQPDLTAAWGNMAKAWSDMEEFEMAVYCYRKAIAIKPEIEFHRGLAKAYRKSGRYDRSAQILSDVLAKAPHDADARFGLAVTLFHQEKYSEAVREFEWRRKTKEMIKHAQDLYPIFQDTVEYAGQDLSNSTLLLHTEQGFGDNLQFARFIRLVKPKVKRLVMWCRPGLGSLFKHSFALDEVTENVFKLPSFDYHLPLLSTAFHFDPALATLGAFEPYLFPETGPAHPDITGNTLNIGLVWGASDSGFDHANKRIPLVRLKPLLNLEGMRWHSLQLGSDTDEIAREGLQQLLVDHSATIANFADTARVVSQLDLVITCDTSVAHLAGAMGKPVWVMLKKNPDWRWHADGESTLWYPSARLYRQDSHGDWTAVIRRIARDLAAWSKDGQRSR
ncbi:MAG: tetratricopeptide repeat protein [Porticoccaceae bacterium]